MTLLEFKKVAKLIRDLDDEIQENAQGDNGVDAAERVIACKCKLEELLDV